MKYKFFIIAALLVFLGVNGCDSPSDSKATTVSTPVLVEPADNATGIALRPHFKWTNEGDQLKYATNSNFDNAITVTVSGTEFTLTESLSPQTTYFWKVGKSSGTNVVWSETYWRFTTGN